MILKTLTLAAVVLSLSSVARAAVIGNWEGSLRSWNHQDMATIHGLMTANGHTVLGDDSIGGSLQTVDVLVIGEPTMLPEPGALSALSDWLASGRILLVLADSAFSGGLHLNAILSAIGSTISFANVGPVVAPFPAGNYATEGPPYNLVGETLGTTPGSAVSGGTALAGSYVHYQQFGNGHIFAFADRSDHNFFAPGENTVNGRFFLNVVHGPAQPIPEPSTVCLMVLGLAGLRVCVSRRRAGSA